MLGRAMLEVVAGVDAIVIATADVASSASRQQPQSGSCRPTWSARP